MIGYLRKSKADRRRREDEAHGIAAQRTAILAEAARRDWSVVWAPADEGWSGANVQRPGLTWALEELAAGRANGIVVSKLDRLGRSLLDFAQLAHVADQQGWTIYALNLGTDLSSPVGRMIFSVLMSFAQLEREMISERTREALAAAKANGVRLGRPSGIDPETVAAILELREAGCTLQAIADLLNDQDIPRAQGGRKWRVSTVRGVLTRTYEQTPNDESTSADVRFDCMTSDPGRGRNLNPGPNP